MILKNSPSSLLRQLSLSFVLLAGAAFSLLTTSSVALGQKEEEVEIPAPQTVVREASDGMLIKCEYYYGCTDEKKKKQTVPIIIVHDDEEEGKVYDGLATLLQHQGHAVIVPDLRGHGGSTTTRSGQGEFTPEDFRRKTRLAVAAMLNDLEAAKSFLMEENNKGELNIELLTVIGVGDMGSTVAINWVASDWSWQQFPGRKQGQDVKSLILLSPATSFKGITSRSALQHAFLQNKYPIKSSILIIAGNQDRAEAGRIFKALENNHEVNDSLYMIDKPTSLSGSKLLNPRLSLKVDNNIVNFIRLKIVNEADNFPWQMRGQ
ncbi:MAG: alpha/beta hydrolase [Pirellulaceae bacterium]